MPADHGRKACRARVEIEVVDLVEHVEQSAARLDHLRHWQDSGPRYDVDVASHRDDRGDAPEALQYSGRADITRVDDGFASFDRVDGLGTQ